MKTVSFSEFRKNASDLLSEVESGENVVILRHGKPIAQVSPVLPPSGNMPSWKRRGLRLTAKGAALSRAIIEERRREDVL